MEYERYSRMATDLLWIEIQQYDLWTLTSGRPADWVVRQFANMMEGQPGLQTIVVNTIENGLIERSFVIPERSFVSP